jgi:hypothetical protein
MPNVDFINLTKKIPPKNVTDANIVKVPAMPSDEISVLVISEKISTNVHRVNTATEACYSIAT